MHSKPTEVNEIFKKAESYFESQRSLLNELKKIVPADEYYKHRDHWKQILSQMVSTMALIEWFRTENLITYEVAQKKIGEMPLELEDFLYGVCQITQELSRYCVNCVTKGNFSMPKKVAAFVGDLYAGFRLLNLKNDPLRKKYDGIKYDLKKIEEVVYDIAIR